MTKIAEFAFICEDKEDRVTLEVFPLSWKGKEEIMLKIIRQYFADYFAESNVTMYRPAVFDYAHDSDRGYRFYWELRKKYSWKEIDSRPVHTETARKINNLNQTVVSVFLREYDRDGGKCVSCAFNKNMEGDYGVRPDDGSIGDSCPVRPGAVETVSECREYRLDIEEFLVFEQYQSNQSIGVLEDG